jgi:Fe2+ transport system protein FeoA
MLQLIRNKAPRKTAGRTLVDLRRGEAAVLDQIDLPADDARRLMELGFLPGANVIAGMSAPSGDPLVFRVDGSEVALRKETAMRLSIRFKGNAAGNERAARVAASSRAR